MTTYVAVLGIDGSGKSTVARILAPLAAGRLGVRAAHAGAGFGVVDPDQDLAAEGFAARGLPVSARLAPALRRAAKWCAGLVWLYPAVKLVQMLVQDLAARRLARRYRADVVFMDGHALLCAAGRWVNYAGGASPDRLLALLDFVRGGPLPPGTGPWASLRLRVMRRALHLAAAFGLDLAWLPDAAVYLDVPPGEALERIARRGAPRDRHENAPDMAQAREAYLASLAALAARGALGVHVLASGRWSAGETCARALDAVEAAIGRRAAPPGLPPGVLGTSAATRSAPWKRALRPGYLAHLVAGWRRGAWREPLFLASDLGRAVLREGYSAGVMGRIYEQDRRRVGRLDRIVLGYPLHRAVHDRLHLVVDVLEGELVRALRGGGEVRVLSAPCGTGEDLVRALERVARRGRAAARRVRVLAADLDPGGEIGAELPGRAAALGVRLDLVRCDLTDPTSRPPVGSAGVDLALFLGLSSWIDKPSLLAHLAWLRGALAPSGALVTDCFSAASYARAGFLAGYRASYYAPASYAALLEACGFDGGSIRTATGRDRINHVFVARPLAAEAGCRTAPPGGPGCGWTRRRSAAGEGA